jgi:DNA mismatch repair ATPase MutS
MLEQNYPDLFINLSMSANEIGYRQYEFPYKIKRGFSYQSIALELLQRENFPSILIDMAIDKKEKLLKSRKL